MNLLPPSQPSLRGEGVYQLFPLGGNGKGGKKIIEMRGIIYN